MLFEYRFYIKLWNFAMKGGKLPKAITLKVTIEITGDRKMSKESSKKLLQPNGGL